MARQQKLIHLHGTSPLSKEAAANAQMVAGELAVMNGTQETSELYVLTSDGNIATFVTGAKVAGDIATAKSGAETTAKGYADQALADAKAYTDTREAVLEGEINAAEDRIATLEGKFTGDNSVAAQIEAAVKAEADRAKLAEQANAAAIDAIEADYLKSTDKDELQDYADQAEADALAAAKAYADGLAKNYDAAGSAADALEDAKEYADGLASNYDAAGSAADALEDAKEYADGLNTTMDGRVKALEADTHTHGNKAELDKIADGDKAKWDAATNRINTFMDSEEIAGTVDTLHEINNWMTSAGANATDLSTAIANEKKAREDADTAIRGEFAEADTTTLNSAKADATTKANAAETNAKAYAKEYADDLAKNYDAAGSAADALADAKDYADGLNTAMDTRVEALEAKFGTGDGSVSKQIADAITAEVARSNKYTDDAIAAEVTRSNGYADQAEADAIAAAKTYTDEVLGGNYTSTNTVTTAFTTAINNAIAGIDLNDSGTGANTGIDVTVEIVDGKTMTVTVDDSNLIIDCGTY